MDDEIDIEEHDVLDNPAIKQMFPDISKLKKEIQSYYNDGDSDVEILSVQPSVKDTTGTYKSVPTNVTEISAIPALNTEDTYDQLQHINSVLCGITVTVEENDDEQSIKDETSEMPMHNNRIILGSKPSNTLKNVTEYETFFEKQVKFNQPKVVLDDLMSYLKESKRYCSSCLTLFPNYTDLQAHNLQVHINSGRGCPMVKLAKFGDKKSNTTLKKSPQMKRFACLKCDITYKYKKNLDHHNKMRHSDENSDNEKDARRSGDAKSQTNKVVSKSEALIKRRIMDRVRIKLQNRKDLASNFRNQCYHCKKNFPDQLSLIEHIYTVLQQENINCKICKRKFLNKENLNKHMLTTHKDIKICKKPKSVGDSILNLYYKCPICYIYYERRSAYIYHLNQNHKIFKTLQFITKNNKFDSTCSLCSNECENFRKFNKHVKNSHQEHYWAHKITQSRKNKLQSKELTIHENPKEIETAGNVQNESLVPKGIIFKCNKCDIHFLSSKTCLSHTEHMEMLINWKCKTCFRIFKKEDSELHEMQHSHSEDFTVTDLSGLSVSRVLFSCPNCAVHFTEAKLVSHFSGCGKEVPKSVYCKICDILIDTTIGAFHQSSHAQENLSKDDFVIITADFCNKQKSFPSGDEEKFKKPQIKMFDKQTRRSSHELSWNFCKKCRCYLRGSHHPSMAKHCESIKKSICSECGLQFTIKSFDAHKILHSKYINLKLQQMKFYNMDGMEICPPLPDFPKCKSCGARVVTKSESHSHKCDQGDRTCNLCNIKLSKNAFKLHMMFHDYSLHERTNEYVLKETKKEKPQECILFDESNSATTSHHNKPLNVTISTSQETTHHNDLLSEIVFCCSNCNLSVDSYDHAIEHCQEHYSRNSSQQLPIVCQLCNIIFDRNFYQSHLKQHSNNEGNIFLKTLMFDVDYFTSENAIWTEHLFKSCTAKQKGDILEESIYKFEARIKMRITQPGPANLTVYKCDKCDCFIDGLSLYRHAENSCFKVRKHPCSKCGIPFISSVSRMEHEQIHANITVDSKSYRIVTFNGIEDEQFNSEMYSQKHYVIYQCRNCNSACDRYQVIKHVCYNNVEKCRACGLLIPLEQYDSHKLKHKDLIRFTEKNIKVILFGDKITTSTSSSNTIFPLFRGIVVDYTFYQCSKCSLCVKSTLGITKHDCVIKSAKSICPVCNLAFPIAKLKNHRKLHETDRDFIKENIKIIPFRPQENVKSSPFPSTSTNYTNVEIEIEDSSDESGESSFEEDTDIVTLHRCKCGIHFLCETSAKQHFSKCNPGTKRLGQKCAKCALIFQPTVLFTHLLKHHGNKSKDFKYNVVDMTVQINVNLLDVENKPDSLETDNDNTNKEDSSKSTEKEITMGKHTFNATLYMCKQCGVHYLCKDTIKNHLDQRHIISTKLHDICNICGLNFSSGSVAKHMYIHHDLLKLAPKDLYVEVVDQI